MNKAHTKIPTFGPRVWNLSLASSNMKERTCRLWLPALEVFRAVVGCTGQSNLALALSS